VRHLIIGGGAIDEQLACELRDFPHAVWSTYGMTETLSHIALRRINGVQCDDYYTPFEGVSVSLNTDGCLVIDAPDVCATTLITNDRAQLAPDGRRFRILGRRDNVVCSGGIKLQIEELERKLRAHIDVPFMVTKRHDPVFGEAVVLLVEDQDRTKYNAICRRVLSKYECPRQVISVERLPMTGTGKLARHEAELIANQNERR
jgi:O-succinylbenzoic acid--CoA ligase